MSVFSDRKHRELGTSFAIFAVCPSGEISANAAEANSNREKSFQNA